jgi:hypothetical protein
VTNYSKGFIQAVSPLGENVWASETPTDDFYDELHLSHDGQFISLAENLFNNENGELIPFNPEYRVNEYIFGEGGHKFMRSMHRIIQWEYGPSGFELLSEGTVGGDEMATLSPLGSFVDASGIVWIFYRNNSRTEQLLLWMTPEGELIGRRTIERSVHNLLTIDDENSLLTECMGFEQTQTLECKAYSPLSTEPIWEVQAMDIPPFNGGFYDGETIYLLGEDDSITAVFVGSPN